MKTKRFSRWQLFFAVLISIGATFAALLLAFRLAFGTGGLAVLESMWLIRTSFVGEYDEVTLVDQTITGMVEGLGDRWSYYLTAEEYEAQGMRRSNQYVGIGVTVSYEREDGLFVTEVNEAGPAFEAGLLPGELITHVDGESIAGELRYLSTERITGEEGSEVMLTVEDERGGVRTIAVVRRSIASNPVAYEMLEDHIGYVQLSNFYDHSAELLKAAVLDLLDQGAEALVFDMRDNGGGYLRELTDMLDFLLPEGVIFRSRLKTGWESETTSDASFIDLPMAILVNEQTYSAAEFFAAALQEDGIGAIVGTPTSGKGYAQQTFPLSGGNAIAISTSEYTTGNGVSLVGTGLTLDLEVEAAEGETDRQLEAAIELLR